LRELRQDAGKSSGSRCYSLRFFGFNLRSALQARAGSWSPDGRKIAFASESEKVQAWIIEPLPPQ